MIFIYTVIHITITILLNTSDILCFAHYLCLLSILHWTVRDSDRPPCHFRFRLSHEVTRFRLTSEYWVAYSFFLFLQKVNPKLSLTTCYSYFTITGKIYTNIRRQPTHFYTRIISKGVTIIRTASIKVITSLDSSQKFGPITFILIFVLLSFIQSTYVEIPVFCE